MMQRMCSLKVLVNICHGIPWISELKKKSRNHQTNFFFLWQWLFLVIPVCPFVVQSKLCLHLNHTANHISDMVNVTKFVLNMKLRNQVLVRWPPLSWLQSTSRQERFRELRPISQDSAASFLRASVPAVWDLGLNYFLSSSCPYFLFSPNSPPSLLAFNTLMGHSVMPC